MSGMIFRIFGDQILVEKMRALPNRVRVAMTARMQEVASKFSAYVKEEKLSGQVLNVVSGKLRASIYARVYSGQSAVTMSTGSRGDVPYAAIHEFGGHTAAHAILPSKARVLQYMSGGVTMYARSVNHPGSVMPERSYIRSALADKSPEITAALSAAVLEEMRR